MFYNQCVSRWLEANEGNSQPQLCDVNRVIAEGLIEVSAPIRHGISENKTTLDSIAQRIVPFKKLQTLSLSYVKNSKSESDYIEGLYNEKNNL